MGKRKKTSDSETKASRSGPGKADHSARSLRARLKACDQRLVQQLNERARLAVQLSAKDAQAVSSSVNVEGVAEIVTCGGGPLSENSLRAIFRELLSGCRAATSVVRVAYLGPIYSYSYLAAVHRFGQSADFAPVSTISAVFEEVERGDAQFGLVPIENSTDGRIADTLDLFARKPTRISGEVRLRIHHNLLGKCPRDQVREVHSKPQALSQCRQWLSSHVPNATIVESPSTTAAAEAAANQEGVAAVASIQAGTNYGLKVLASHIEDNPDNITRFAVIGASATPRTANDVTTMMFQVSHEPGALADAMTIFKRNRLNLTWIESFPLRGSPNEYLFFVELEGHESDLRVKRAIASLGRKAKRLEVLGSYARAEPVE